MSYEAQKKGANTFTLQKIVFDGIGRLKFVYFRQLNLKCFDFYSVFLFITFILSYISDQKHLF